VKNDLEVLHALREVLLGMEDGRGISNSLVKTTAGDAKQLSVIARDVLLGLPPMVAMRILIDSETPEIGILASLIVHGGTGSSTQTGRKGEGLSLTLENLIKSREAERMEARVYNLRSLMIVGVLGAVMGMISTLGPIFGALNLSPSTEAAPLTYQITAGIMVCLSAAMLGSFMVGRHFPLHVLVAIATFLIVVTVSSPFASITFPNALGIK
jgi:hypothetical protein